MKKLIVILTALLTLSSCSKSIFVWTFGDAFALFIILVFFLGFLISYFWDLVSNWFKTNKKK